MHTSLCSQEHGGADRVCRKWLANTAGEGTEEIFLVERQIILRNEKTHIAAESGVDSVDDLSGRYFFF